MTHNPPRLEAARFLATLATCFALTVSLAWLFGQRLVELALPAARVGFDAIDSRIAATVLDIDHSKEERTIRVRATVTLPLVGGQRALFPNGQEWFQSSMPMLAMLIPLVIAVPLAAAWPARSRAVLCVQVALALALGMAWLFIDIPLTLFAFTWSAFESAFDPEGDSMIVAWLALMNAGGRFAAGALLAVLACFIAQRLADRRAPR